MKDIKEIESYDWFKYQWEFMRRGEYKTLYENIPDDQKDKFPNPDLSFNDLIGKENKESLIALIFQLNNILPRSVRFEIIDNNSFHNISINIDFSQINSVESLKRWVSKIIDDHYNLLLKKDIYPRKEKSRW